MEETAVADDRLGCPFEKWASYQELLLSMAPPTVEEIAGTIDADPICDDPNCVALLVESVAGARKNERTRS
jgi:hypothetical protein